NFLGKTIRVEDPLPGFVISAGTTSATLVPTVWHDKASNRVFLDCAGFHASQGKNWDVVNAYALRRLLSRFPQAKVLWVASWSSLADRGQDFLDLLNQVAGTFPEEEKLQKALSLVITKYPDLDN